MVSQEKTDMHESPDLFYEMLKDPMKMAIKAKSWDFNASTVPQMFVKFCEIPIKLHDPMDVIDHKMLKSHSFNP